MAASATPEMQQAQVTPHDIAEQILAHKPPTYNFKFSRFLLSTYRLGVDPEAPLCKAYIAGHCPNGTLCTERHIAADKFVHSHYNNLVCKHWLRGLCKKGEHCEFVHEYNLRKMPECSQYSKQGWCSNGEECLYLHIGAKSKLPLCPWFERGFCKLGPRCSKRHAKKKFCPFYLAGFCPDGRHCKEGAHPKWREDKDLPPAEFYVERDPAEVEEEIRQMREEAERREDEERERFGGGRGGRGGRWMARGGGYGGDARRQRGRGHLH